MLLLPFLGENHLSDDTENRSYMVFNEKVKKKGKPIVTDGFHRNRGQPTVLTKNERHGLCRLLVFIWSSFKILQHLNVPCRVWVLHILMSYSDVLRYLSLFCLLSYFKLVFVICTMNQITFFSCLSLWRWSLFNFCGLLDIWIEDYRRMCSSVKVSVF